VRVTVKEELAPINGELEALRNDIQKIYDMLADLQNKVTPDKEFQELSLE
jgi:hypothetical protein